jgi:hypothetical protein
VRWLLLLLDLCAGRVEYVLCGAHDSHARPVLIGATACADHCFGASAVADSRRRRAQQGQVVRLCRAFPLNDDAPCH